MYDEEDWFRVEAHTPPETSPLAWSVFKAIHSNAESCSTYLSGMAISYLCLDKIKLIKLAKELNGIDLRRYGHFIDLYDNKLKEINRRKSDGK